MLLMTLAVSLLYLILNEESPLCLRGALSGFGGREVESVVRQRKKVGSSVVN